MKSNKLGVYLHIPFCIKKCNYCDFCSFPNRLDEIDAYACALARRIRIFSAEHGKREADTVYFGGGTPTLMSAKSFSLVMSALREAFDISADAEISVECNPATIDAQGLADLRAVGVSRLSIGVQSANDAELALLGRIHTYEDFLKTYNDARGAGFDNISVDLMYGIPNQTQESFRKTLDTVVSIAPEHISAYGLKIEKNTEFYRNFDAYDFPDSDAQAEFYELCCDYLAKNGYERYEISNFSKAGKESKHNLKYWLLDDYIGFGVAAHSCFLGERFGNSRDIEAFLRGEDICCEREKISDKAFLDEYVMLSLRLAQGIDTSEFFKLANKEFKKAFPMVNAYIKGGFMTESDKRIAFTTKGFLVSNVILSEMLSFEN